MSGEPGCACPSCTPSTPPNQQRALPGPGLASAVPVSRGKSLLESLGWTCLGERCDVEHAPAIEDGVGQEAPLPFSSPTTPLPEVPKTSCRGDLLLLLLCPLPLGCSKREKPGRGSQKNWILHILREGDEQDDLQMSSGLCLETENPSGRLGKEGKAGGWREYRSLSAGAPSHACLPASLPPSQGISLVTWTKTSSVSCVGTRQPVITTAASLVRAARYGPASSCPSPTA